MPRILLFLLPLSMVLSACQKEERDALFEINYTVDVNIQPGWNTFETYYVEIDGLSTRVQQQLESRDLSHSDIGRVETAYAELYVIFNDVNLDLLDEATVDIFPAGQPSSTLEAAYLNPVPENARTRIQLIPSLANFKDFFNNEFFGLRVGLRPREIPTQVVECRLELKMAFLE